MELVGIGGGGAACDEAALAKSDGMVSQAAEALKLRRTTLIEKMKKLMIERPAPAEEGRQVGD